MSKRMGEWISRHRFWVIAASAVVVLAMLAAAVAALRWWETSRDRGGGSTVPLLVDTSTSGTQAGAQVSEVQVVSVIGGGSSGEDRLGIRLSEGREGVQEAVSLPVARGEPLTAAEMASILARLPALEDETGDVVDFRRPQDSLPPPRPGQTVEEAFPPPEAPVAPPPVKAGPLEVLRFAPEGEIPWPPLST
jgi:hypothetical protein